ncbi:sugar phosphate isomerase/epimerase family protein [Scatolibacter rhodanostii]|uniref:sugar phosphate isomerase/epimerase family protein n=1 Tax=Scatolibacter rhodanostii TaxID=2014781 RepID=UPI000C0706C8|nr:sugar phosphate isomerase/epimerase family protein [Scatolibacter rhodanostii]
MYPFKIGIITDSFNTDFFTALDKSYKLGASGIQTRATYGDFSPEELTSAKRKEILAAVKDKGMIFSALCGDLGKGFGDPALNPSLIEKSKRILDLAKELETDIVTTHIGVVPTDKNHPRYGIMLDACGQLAEYADSISSHFAIETGPETAETLKNFLDELHSTGVSVNLDPANFVMVTGDDPVAAVYTLKDYIVHTHAKDGRKLRDVSPEIVYGLEEDDMLASDNFIELPLGQGDVDFKNYCKALNDIGYKGYLTIEREVGADPEKDIATAVSFLKPYIL